MSEGGPDIRLLRQMQVSGDGEGWEADEYLVTVFLDIFEGSDPLTLFWSSG